MNIGIVGFGSIGGTIADMYDKLGYSILGNDVTSDQVEGKGHKFYTKEEIDEEADIVFIVVPTPTVNGGTDLSTIRDALQSFRGTDTTVVIRSTVPPGTTNQMSEEYDLPLVHMPEMLRDEWGVQEAMNPDRLIFAGPASQRKQVVGLHVGLDTVVLEYDDPTVAELGKYAHNAFFATKVSFANQMRLIAKEMNIDPTDIMNIVTADFRNTEYHLDPTKGPYGGKCLPKDLASLMYKADELDVSHPLFEGVHEVNRLTKEDMGANTESQQIEEFDPSIYSK